MYPLIDIINDSKQNSTSEMTIFYKLFTKRKAVNK